MKSLGGSLLFLSGLLGHMRFLVRRYKSDHGRILILVMQYKRHIPSLLQATEGERDGLARILKESLVRYDNLFR